MHVYMYIITYQLIEVFMSMYVMVDVSDILVPMISLHIQQNPLYTYIYTYQHCNGWDNYVIGVINYGHVHISGSGMYVDMLPSSFKPINVTYRYLPCIGVLPSELLITICTFNCFLINAASSSRS